VLFIATDDCGAADTCMTTISVINLPPVAACLDTTIVTDGQSCTGTIDPEDLDDGTVDPEGQDITFALDPPPPYALGAHAVLFITSDVCGAADTCQTNITVINNAPMAAALEQIIVLGDTVTCMSSIDASAFDDGSSDPDGWTLTFSTVPPAPYPVGLTALLFIVSDGCESDTTTTEIIVQCNKVAITDNSIPLHFAVDTAVPNPFQGSTRIQLALPEARFVRAQVFDVAGRRVAELMNRRMEAGRWDISWDGRRNDGSATGAGIYLIRIQAGVDIVTRKAIRVR
jgi:hypothetical protein